MRKWKSCHLTHEWYQIQGDIPAFGAVVDGFHVDDVQASDKPVLNNALDRFGVSFFQISI